MEHYNHLDGDIMSLLQVVDLVEGILKVYHVENVKNLPWNRSAVKTLEVAGFKVCTVMQIWQNIAQITETLKDSELPMGKQRFRTDYFSTLLAHAFWEGFHMQMMMRGITGYFVLATVSFCPRDRSRFNLSRTPSRPKVYVFGFLLPGVAWDNFLGVRRRCGFRKGRRNSVARVRATIHATQTSQWSKNDGILSAASSALVHLQ